MGLVPSNSSICIAALDKKKTLEVKDAILESSNKENLDKKPLLPILVLTLAP